MPDSDIILFIQKYDSKIFIWFHGKDYLVYSGQIFNCPKITWRNWSVSWTLGTNWWNWEFKKCNNFQSRKCIQNGAAILFKSQWIKPMSTLGQLDLGITDVWHALQWRHNERDRVSNHQPHDCLLNRLFTRRSKKTSKPRVTGLCVGNSPGTGEFPAQMASNAENVSIWWRHHELFQCCLDAHHSQLCCRLTTLALFVLIIYEKTQHDTYISHQSLIRNETDR